MVHVAALVALVLAAAPPTLAQGRDRAPQTRTTTIEVLTRHALFFSRQRVRIQGTVTVEPGVDAVWLSDGTKRIVLADSQNRAHGPGDRFEATGTFWDVGRLQPDDPRLPTFDFRALARTVLNRDWPGPGELLVLLVEAIAPFTDGADASLRAIALDPSRFEGKRVTIAGRFRGANLYGDLPVAAGKSKWDFVLQSADAALWITGLQPKGRGFSLDPKARVDTGRWVRVTGVLRHEGGLAWLEAQEIQETDARAEEDAPPVPEPVFPAVLEVPPLVIFSAPVQDDTDVSPTATVRIQFSRDMDAASFKDRVKVSYFGDASETPPPPAFTFTYRQATRVLEVQFRAPLERFRTVRVDLADGITSSSGLSLGAWALTFTIGGR